MCMVSLYLLAILCCHTIDWDIFLRYWCLSQIYYYYYYYYYICIFRFWLYIYSLSFFLDIDKYMLLYYHVGTGLCPKGTEGNLSPPSPLEIK